MFSEMMMVTLLMLLSSQSSSLWSSLIIIPMSLFLILSSSSMNLFSGLFIFMFVMIFIGGLLVLLLSVVSISYQEQGYNFMKMWVLVTLVLFVPLIFSLKEQSNPCSFLFGASWLEHQSVFYMIFMSILIISLLTISKLIMSFSGLIRSI